MAVNKKLLITHVDLDGVGVAVLAEYFKEKLGFRDILYLNYDFERDDEVVAYILQFDDIVITDLTLDKGICKSWVTDTRKVTIYDHHDATSWITNIGESVWDENRCGTKIFWEEYVKPRIGRYKPIVDEFVELVNAYDQWDQDSDIWEDAKDLNTVLYAMKDYQAVGDAMQCRPFNRLMKLKFDKLPGWVWTKKEQTLIDKAHIREEEIYQKARSQISIRVDAQDRIFGVCLLPSKISVVASRILEEEENMDYIIIINSWGGITGRISFRSRNGFDCTSLLWVKGHKAAAGIQIPAEHAIEFWKDESLAFLYEDDDDLPGDKPYAVMEV